MQSVVSLLPASPLLCCVLSFLLVVYPLWFLYSARYATLMVQVPWRSACIDFVLRIDTLLLTRLCGVRRTLLWTLPLQQYKHPLGHCFTIAPHHLLFPSFLMPFYAELSGVQSSIGVDASKTFAAAARSLFLIPLLREVVLTLGGRVASPAVVAQMATFGIAPGGVHEMVRQEDGVDRIYLRRGFARLCVRRGGLSLVPCYAFDENSLYRPLFLGDLPRRAQRWAHRRLGVGVPFWTGGLGIPFNPVPRRGEYVLGIGRPIDVRDVITQLGGASASEDLVVDKVLEMYILELRRLFQELKDKTGRRKDAVLIIDILETRHDRKEHCKKA